MNMHTTQPTLPPDITLQSGEVMDDLLTTDALRFMHRLHQKFDDRRRALLKARNQRQKGFDSGTKPSFSDASNFIQASRWKVAPATTEIRQRMLEYVGPADVPLNYLDGLQADTFVADLEDATAPGWNNIIRTHQNLRDGISGKNNLSAFPILGLKPRALSRTDNSILINGQPVSASLLDFALFFYHNAPRLVDKGLAPYLLLPKIESNCEARWWNQVFVFSQYHLGIPQGTVKGVVVIDNILAGFQLNDILYELRDHAAGLAFEPVNYLKSIVEKFPRSVMLPSISELSMELTGLNAVRRLIIETSYLRNSRNIGMPVRSDNIDAVYNDIMAGYDGMRLSDPEHSAQIREYYRDRDDEIFHMEEYQINEEDLLSFPMSRISFLDFQSNIRNSLLYLSALHEGLGRINQHGKQIDRALAGLMIGQLWQWLHNTVKLDNGQTVTR